MSSSNPKLTLDKFLATAGKLTMPELVQWPTIWAEWSKPYLNPEVSSPTEAAIVLCIPGSDEKKNAQYWSAAYDHTLAHYLLGHATFMGYGDGFETIKSALSGFVEYVEEHKIQKSYVVICVGDNKSNELNTNNFISDIEHNKNINSFIIDIILRKNRSNSTSRNSLTLTYIPLGVVEYLDYLGSENKNINHVIERNTSNNIFWENIPLSDCYFGRFYELATPMFLFHDNDMKSDTTTKEVITSIITNNKDISSILQEKTMKKEGLNEVRKRKIKILAISWLLIEFYFFKKINVELFLQEIREIKSGELMNYWYFVGKLLKEDLVLQLALLHLFTELDFFADHNHKLIQENWNNLKQLTEHEITLEIPGSDNEISISLRLTLQSLLQRIKEAMEMKERIKAIEAALPTSVDRIEELMTLRKDFEFLKTQITEQDHPDIIEERLNDKYTLFVAAFAIIFIFGAFLLIFIPSIKGY